MAAAVNVMESAASVFPQLSPTTVNFATAGIGGMMGWTVVHPFNTICIQMNLASASAVEKTQSFSSFASTVVREKGFKSLYTGLSAGLLRQLFYTTSRLGLFELFRDEVAKYRKTDIWSRLATGVVSGGMAALISCPAEVTLVRISNDCALPAERRRNYTGVLNAFSRIMTEEGFKTFFSGCGPLVNRAMLVGAIQVGTYDQFRETFREYGVTHEFTNVLYASMTSGLLLSVLSMPLETAKNRMAFQKPDPVTGKLPYTSASQTMMHIVKTNGALRLWSGFTPYYLRCGGQTILMFTAVEWLRKIYKKYSASP
jgi:solute carrier family 25 oxoglutarate transporter 11